jgi:hypothetical protein
MTHQILSETAASISELKRNPMGTVAAGDGFPVAILNRNESAVYCMPAKPMCMRLCGFFPISAQTLAAHNVFEVCRQGMPAVVLKASHVHAQRPAHVSSRQRL